MIRSLRPAALVTTTLLLAACADAAGQVTPNGAPDAPVTLTGISYHVTGRSGGDQLVKFSELAKSLSNGSITIKAGPEPDSGRPDTSAEAIAMVRDDRADLGIVSARTFDTLGVTSFQALQAPYLVTSNELIDKVLADPVAAKMLEGTTELGLVGLGLAFDFLAYPGGFEEPVLSPDDYRGKAFQVRPSRANDLLTQALGATSDPRNGQDFEKAVEAKEVRGSWGYFNEPSQPVGGEIFTANEPAFARANVIVANEKVFAGLSAAQQQALRAAAAQTREWMATRHTDPAVTAAAYCAQGFGDIAIATPAELEAMKAATAPVVAALEREELTRDVIARIRELSQDVEKPTAPVACSEVPSSLPLPRLEPEGDQRAIDGVWRLEVDEQVLLEANQSPMDATNNAGTWTWTFDDGTYAYTESGGRTCTGKYDLNGSQFLAVTFSPLGCDLVWPLVFSRSGDELVFAPSPDVPTGIPDGQGLDGYTPDPSGFTAAYFHNPLVRVGDAP
jgi:TRAP-type C4-dicarboxylate transport system substrate-binding protein